jgi:hypothetical protein
MTIIVSPRPALRCCVAPHDSLCPQISPASGGSLQAKKRSRRANLAVINRSPGYVGPSYLPSATFRAFDAKLTRPRSPVSARFLSMRRLEFKNARYINLMSPQLVSFGDNHYRDLVKGARI